MGSVPFTAACARAQNCFYRSFIVSLFKRFVEGGVVKPVEGVAPATPLQAKYEEVLAYATGSKDRLLAFGYPPPSRTPHPLRVRVRDVPVCTRAGPGTLSSPFQVRAAPALRVRVCV